jgi:non-specific serine/threonine protein kinase
MCLIHLGMLALIRGDYEGVPPLLREGLRLAWEFDATVSIQISLHGLACVAASREQPVRAARLWGAVEGMREAYGVHLTPITYSQTNYEGHLSTARSKLGDEEMFAAAWAEGEAMSLERAIEYALSTEEPSPPATSQETHADEPAKSLTRRQREVALLIGQGYTNAQIAEALAISKYTVANHVARILRKLNLPSRSRIAAWVTEMRLQDPE